MSSDSDKLVEAWGKAYLADGDKDAVVTEFTIREDYRTVEGTGCETCGYGGEEYPYAVDVSGKVNDEWVFKEWTGTMEALIEMIQTYKVMSAMGVVFGE